MEAIPINIIGKGGSSCIPGEPCIFLNHTPITQESPLLMVFVVLGAVFTLAAFIIIKQHPLQWIKEKFYMRYL